MPVDFEGKPVTSSTYTGDWKFDKKQGAWITTRQAKQAHRTELRKRQARRATLAANAAPVSTAPTTTTVPLPGVNKPPATSPEVPDVLWETSGMRKPIPQTPQVPQLPGGVTPPAWWINTAYTNPTQQQAFANAANAILPTLSPEDQRNMASYLATNFKDTFGAYANASFAPIPTQLDRERFEYINPQRGRAALDMLNRVQQAAGGSPGKGYDYLRSALKLIGQYSTPGTPMTREQYQQFANAVKDLTSQAGGDLSAYSNLAQLFNLPGFTAGDLVSNAPTARLNV